MFRVVLSVRPTGWWGGQQKAATRRNMRREERVTVQGPVKEQQPDGMSHRGGGGGNEGKGKFVHLKWASNFWALYSKFHFPPEENLLGGLAWVGGSARSHTPPRPPIPPRISTSLTVLCVPFTPHIPLYKACPRGPGVFCSLPRFLLVGLCQNAPQPRRLPSPHALAAAVELRCVRYSSLFR